MFNPKPVSENKCKIWVQVDKDVGIYLFYSNEFNKNAIIFFPKRFIIKIWIVNSLNELYQIPTDICSSPPAILNSMNLHPGLVSWFYESRFSLRKSSQNKHKRFCNCFRFWSNKQGLYHAPKRQEMHIVSLTNLCNLLFPKQFVRMGLAQLK